MKIHYAGALSFRRSDGALVEIASGYAACCSGPKARKIRGQGNHTWDRKAVTCVPCQKLMKL